MTPIIRKLYKTPDEITAALKRHLVFFNTEPNVGGVIHGAVIATPCAAPARRGTHRRTRRP